MKPFILAITIISLITSSLPTFAQDSLLQQQRLNNRKQQVKSLLLKQYSKKSNQLLDQYEALLKQNNYSDKSIANINELLQKTLNNISIEEKYVLTETFLDRVSCINESCHPSSVILLYLFGGISGALGIQEFISLDKLALFMRSAYSQTEIDKALLEQQKWSFALIVIAFAAIAGGLYVQNKYGNTKLLNDALNKTFSTIRDNQESTLDTITKQQFFTTNTSF